MADTPDDKIRKHLPPEVHWPDSIPDPVRQDWTGSISGFDLPADIPIGTDHKKYDPFGALSRVSQNSKHPDVLPPGFDPDIFANELEFGAGMPHSSREKRAKYLEFNGREDEAFERDE